MSLAALISQGTRDLLERLRPHLDVDIEIFNAALVPTLPERSTHADAVLRGLTAHPTNQAPPSPHDILASALNTGRHRLLTDQGVRIGLFPLRHGPRIVAVLATATPLGADASRHEGDDAPASEADRRLERVGWSLRTTIESDIVKGERLSEHERRSLWLGSALRFLDHLHTCRSERELFDGIVQAAAIWGDVDARIYRRVLDEGFELEASLPAVADRGPQRLTAHVPGLHQGPVRVKSIPELEQLGFAASDGELLLLPLPPDGQADWLLAVTGPLDAELERVLATVSHTAAALVERLALERSRTLHDRLLGRLAAQPGRVLAQAAALVAELAATVGASGARLIVREAADGPPRVLASVGASALAPAGAVPPPPDGLATSTRLALPLDLGLGVPALIELTTTGARFTAASLQLAEAGAAVIEVWLGGVFTGLSQAPHEAPAAARATAFEARLAHEVRRARDAKLAAGLLVIDLGALPLHGAPPPDEAVDVVRAHVRASDLVGELAEGELAALLVASTPASVDAVVARVAERLASTLAAGTASPRLGRASFPEAGDTASALVSAARHDLARRGAPTTRL